MTAVWPSRGSEPKLRRRRLNCPPAVSSITDNNAWKDREGTHFTERSANFRNPQCFYLPGGDDTLVKGSTFRLCIFIYLWAPPPHPPTRCTQLEYGCTSSAAFTAPPLQWVTRSCTFSKSARLRWWGRESFFLSCSNHIHKIYIVGLWILYDIYIYIYIYVCIYDVNNYIN